MPPEEAIIEKIKKLHAKAVNAEKIGSLDEAKAFAQKVQEMVNKHKIDMSQVNFQNYDKEVIEILVTDWTKYGYENKNVREQWTSQLVNAITKHNQCIYLVHKNNNRCIIHGRKTDLESVEYMLSTLVPMCLRLGYQAYHKLYHEIRPLDPDERKRILKGYKASWKDGFVDGIFESLQESREATKASSGESGLIRIDNMLIKVREFVAQKYQRLGKAAPASQRAHNSTAYQNGHQVGTSVMRKDRLDG